MTMTKQETGKMCSAAAPATGGRIRAGIIGATGYAGAEIARILAMPQAGWSAPLI